MKGITVLVLVALATAVSADPTPTPETLYSEGQEAYDRADYMTAIVKWKTSYDLSGEHALLFNIAQAHRLGGDCSSALAAYKQFLALDPIAQGQGEPPNDQHVLAEEFVRELEPICGWRIPVRPVRERATTIEPTVPTVIVKTHERTRPGQPLRIAGLVTGGVGVVSIAVGLAVGRHALSLADEVTRACSVSCDWSVQGSKDKAGRRDAVLGYTLDAVGITAVIGGTTMYYLGHRSAVSIAPRTREGGAVVSWSGSW